MEPLSRLLETCDKIEVDDISRNHLLFIDDIKLLATDQPMLQHLCDCTLRFMQKVGFKINKQKSATNTRIDDFVETELDQINGYKYLGVYENSNNIIKEENKILIKDKVINRISKLCQTKLNAINLFSAINEYAISNINYFVGLAPYKVNEFKQFDKDIRRILYQYNIIRKSSNIDRLYLNRKELGRNLTNIEHRAELILLGLHEYLGRNNESRTILSNEVSNGTYLGMIKYNLSEKYCVEMFDLSIIKEKQKTKIHESISAKKLHSELFNNDNVDIKMSSLWLSKANISPQQEGILCKIQDRNLYFNNTTCPCKRSLKSVDHLATRCGRMAHNQYKHRHDEVARSIHLFLANQYGITKRKRMKNYVCESVVSNNNVVIKYDNPISTELVIQHNRPDILVHDKQKNEIMIIEIGITNKEILDQVEKEKMIKYDLLSKELASLHNANVTTIPVVMTWDGLTTKNLAKHIGKIGLPNKILAYIQQGVIRHTSDIILNDLGQAE
ncbi:hypothetical protein BLA29_004332 [Euroglyphus maynei]|uniref:Reverse transcriptase domain-containing protein n=1 Tax=Euroglyphus maynei TaxID=6958 RepID=A0A1Y3B8B1_EURMA|nr:hypothetical protein BLA29_004332 [Euroglyphus maynei]